MCSDAGGGNWFSFIWFSLNTMQSSDDFGHLFNDLLVKTVVAANSEMHFLLFKKAHFSRLFVRNGIFMLHLVRTVHVVTMAFLRSKN